MNLKKFLLIGIPLGIVLLVFVELRLHIFNSWGIVTIYSLVAAFIWLAIVLGKKRAMSSKHNVEPIIGRWTLFSFSKRKKSVILISSSSSALIAFLWWMFWAFFYQTPRPSPSPMAYRLSSIAFLVSIIAAIYANTDFKKPFKKRKYNDWVTTTAITLSIVGCLGLLGIFIVFVYKNIGVITAIEV